MEGIEQSKQWFVLRDFKKWNAKSPAYKELPKFGIRHFTPMQWIIVTRNGKRKREYVPVIQNLLFAYDSRIVLDPIIAKTETLQYQYIRGAGKATPMTVSDKEMERFIAAVNSDSSPTYFSPDELTPDMLGKDIIVTGGPLNGYNGKLLKVQGSKKKRLIVEIKGLMVAAVEVAPEFIQLVKD